MHDQMVKCLREQGPASSVDMSKSISDATQSAIVMRLENELAAQRVEQAEREQSLNRQLEEQGKAKSETQMRNEKLSLVAKDLEWQLTQLKEKNSEQARQI